MTQRGIAEQLFYIYPAESNDDQNQPVQDADGKPQLYAPRKSLPELGNFHQQVRGWIIRRNVKRARRRMHGSNGPGCTEL